MHSTYLSGLILLILTGVSCKDKPSEEVSLAAVSKFDVAYGIDPAQKLDCFLPAGRTSETTRVMVLIHGGAWVSGDKQDFNAYIDTLRRRLPDYAFFNVNYRLATTMQNTFPAQENDIKAALNFIHDKCSEFSISNKFVFLGASAGAHLALLQGYKNASPVKPVSVINFFGPSDMTDMHNNPPASVNPALISILVGGTPASNPDAYYQSSPINFVSAQSPPTLTFQGGLDPLVKPAQQTVLHTKLNANGVVNEYVFYQNEAHGWFGSRLSDSFNKIQQFLGTNAR